MAEEKHLIDVELGELKLPNKTYAKQDDSDKALGLCHGSCSTNLQYGACCALTIALPIVFTTASTQGVVAYVILVLWALGLVYCCISLTPVFKPPAPAPELHSAITDPTANNPGYKKLDPKNMHIHVLVNPFGGLGKGLQVLEESQKIWAEAGIKVTVLKTERAGHAWDYIRELDLEGVDGVVAIGGDGTFHEMVNGYMNRNDKSKTTTLGLIPGGSGNSVMCDLGTWDTIEAAKRIASGDTFGVDVIRVTDDKQLDIFSVNCVLFGLLGDLGAWAEDVRFLGPSRYDAVGLWGVLKRASTDASVKIFGSSKELTGREGAEAKFTAEDECEYTGSLSTVVINQTQYFGKGVRPSPLATWDDGKADVLVVTAMTRGHGLELFQQVPSGAHLTSKQPNSSYYQASKVTIEPNLKVGVLNIDGEVYGYEGKICTEVIPRAYQMFIPLNQAPMDFKKK